MLKANERVEADSETTSCNHHLRSEIQNAIFFIPSFFFQIKANTS